MAFPVMLALGVGSTLGSMFANSAANSSVNRARQAAYAAERARQAGFDKEADAVNTGAQDRYIGFGDKMAQRGDALGDYFATPANGGPSLPAPSSPLVAREIAAQDALARAYGDQQAQALGDLRSFGDLFGDISRLQARDAGTISQIGSFKRGSAGVNAMEMEAAGEAGSKSRLLGDILGGVGRVATAGALSGAAPIGLSSLFAPNPITIAGANNPMWAPGGTGWF